MIDQIASSITFFVFIIFALLLFITAPEFTISSGIHLLLLLVISYFLGRNINNLFLIIGFCLTYMLIYRKRLTEQISGDSQKEARRPLDIQRIREQNASK